MEDEKLVQLYLFIAIRGMDKLSDSLSFLRSLESQKGFSRPFLLSVSQWKTDLTSWIQQKNSPKKKRPDIEQVLRIKDYKIDTIATKDLVKQLISAKRLHAKLGSSISKSEKSKSYLYLGQLYQHFTEASVWDLPETYFEACIRNTPGHAIAKKCFELYKETIVFGFTGSRGTEIPHFASEKIKQLATLAGVQ